MDIKDNLQLNIIVHEASPISANWTRVEVEPSINSWTFGKYILDVNSTDLSCLHASGNNLQFGDFACLTFGPVEWTSVEGTRSPYRSTTKLFMARLNVTQVHKMQAQFISGIFMDAIPQGSTAHYSLEERRVVARGVEIDLIVGFENGMLTITDIICDDNMLTSSNIPNDTTDHHQATRTARWTITEQQRRLD